MDESAIVRDVQGATVGLRFQGPNGVTHEVQKYRIILRKNPHWPLESPRTDFYPQRQRKLWVSGPDANTAEALSQEAAEVTPTGMLMLTCHSDHPQKERAPA